MNWWDKLLSSRMSAVHLHGRNLGTMFSSAIEHIESLGREYLGFEDNDLAQQAFFTATFSVLGYLARHEGDHAAREINIADQVMEHMQLDANDTQAAQDLFFSGQQPGFPLAEVLDNFGTACRHRRNLLHIFLEIQITYVCTQIEESLSSEHEDLLLIGKSLGLTSFDIDYLIELVQAQQFYAHGGRGEFATAPFKVPAPLSGCYSILGVADYATDREVTAAYRRLMNQHHPDKLAARGASEEMMRRATEKTQEIKAAYNEIMSERAGGIKNPDTDRFM